MLRLLVLILQELECITNNASLVALGARATIFVIIITIGKAIFSVRHGDIQQPVPDVREQA